MILLDKLILESASLFRNLTEKRTAFLQLNSYLPMIDVQTALEIIDGKISDIQKTVNIPVEKVRDIKKEMCCCLKENA